MSSVRKLSPTGDFVFGNGLNDFYKDVPEYTGQIVETSLLLFLGEWYLDTTAGVPYFNGVLGKHSQSLADATIQDAVLGVDTVVDIRNYQSTLNPDERSLSIEFTVDSAFGPTVVQMENYINF